LKFLKLCSYFNSSQLNYICNGTLFTGVFSDRQKYATIRPLFKRGNKDDIDNYRPISILTSFSKIFEKVLQTRLLKHLTDHNILVKEQYGFRTKLKTVNATYHLTNEILNDLNNNLFNKLFKKYYHPSWLCGSICLVQLTPPHSMHYRHTKHMLPHNHDG